MLTEYITNQKEFITAPKASAIIPSGVFGKPFACGAFIFLHMVGIYKIQSKIKPDRIYIGSTLDFKKRQRSHLSNLRLNKHHSLKLQHHYNKYGKSDLIFAILICCDKEELVPDKNGVIQIEQFYLDVHNPYFNVCKIAGKPPVIKLTDEDKKRIRNRMIGNNYGSKNKGRIGKKLSEEAKIKIGNANRGRKHTEETIIKMRLAQKNHPGYSKGKHLSLEHRRKLSIAGIGKKRPPITDETRKKMSESQKKRIFPKTGKMSDEVKMKISNAKKGSIPWNKNKPWSAEMKIKLSNSHKQKSEPRT